MTASHPTPASTITEGFPLASALDQLATAAPTTDTVQILDGYPPMAKVKIVSNKLGTDTTPSETAKAFVGMMSSREEKARPEQVRFPTGSNRDIRGVERSAEAPVHWIYIQMVLPGEGARIFPYRVSDIELVRDKYQQADWQPVSSLRELHRSRGTPFKLVLTGDIIRIYILTH